MYAPKNPPALAVESVKSVLDVTDRYYYQAGALDQLIDDVLDAREERRQSLKEYDALIIKK